MERNREARRGTMAAAATNGGGGGLPRRRQRNSSSFRDSPEEDGRMEMPDTSRLRDRGSKKDRDRDRSSRSRRRRGERMLHGSNRDRDEGDDSSEESMDQDDEDEDEGMPVPVRLPPSSPPLPNPVAASSPQQNQQHNNHHHHHQQPPRKSFPPKAVKWKADEMIGVPVPRKARSASTKRAHEPPVTGGGGGGGGDHISHQASMSPSRLSPISTTQLSPSSSNGSLRKKMKPMTGAKHRPPKFSKSASCQDEIEIEVAEVLFGMTRQFDSLPKQDSYKIDSRDIDGGSGNEAKSRVSSPSSVSPSPAAYSAALPSSNSCSNPASLPTVAPKRKRPRPVKFDEETPTSLVVLHNYSSLSAPVAKVESENQIKPEVSSPKSEKNIATPVKNGGAPLVTSVSQSGLSDVQRQESAKAEKCKTHDQLPTGRSNSGDRVVETIEDLVSRANGDSDVNLFETAAKKNAPESPNEEKFKFDLMAPPPGKLSPERDDFNVFDRDHKLHVLDIEMAPKMNTDKAEEKPAEIAVMRDEHQTAKFGEKDADLKKQTVNKQALDLPIDFEKPKKQDVSFDKMETSKQQSKDLRQEPKQEKSGSASSLHVPLTVGSWPGVFPPYGYMGQVPPLQASAPINGTAGSSSSVQPPGFLQAHPRPKRCSTHCFIAQMISNYEKFARMNSFWTAAAGAAPFYGAKPCNQSVVPPSDSALSGHQMQGAFLGANAGALPDTKGTPVAALSLPGNSASQEKMPQANNTHMETAQRKQVMLQQMPKSGSTSNMPHGPAFIFPINQAPLLQPAAAASGVGRVGAAKSTTSANGEIRTSAAISSAVGSSVAGGSATPMNLSFTNMLPNDAQYVAFLQNYGYPFPIPAQFTGAPFRGTSNAQAMPFFYPSHMLHPQQLRPQQQQQAGPLPHVQQTHQNPSTLSGSSHKHSQQSINEFPATNQRQDLLSQQGHPKECSKGVDESLTSADGTMSQSQKRILCQTIFEPIHPQNFACVPNAAAIHVAGHGDKQPIYQQAQHKQNMKAELAPQTFTIPFASYGGAVSPPTGLDFSSIAQNHAILQSLPESSRHGYYQMASAPVAATAQATELKKNNHVSEDGKTIARQSMNTNINDEEDRKDIVASKGTQHSSLSFAKTDVDPAITTVLGNGINDLSSRQVNLIQPLTSRSFDRPACATPASTSLSATTISTNSHQQQHHPIHLPKHQQQQLQMQHHLAPSRSKPSSAGSSVAVHPENLSGGATITMFPHALTGFPQALIQGGSSIQWPQGKSSTGRGADPAGASPAPVVKNNFLQLQGRASQQSLPSQGHQTQISFGINGNKQGGQHLPGTCGSPSPSSATVAVLSPSNSVSRSAGGSPRASSTIKPSSQTSAILLPQQTAVKQSTSSSSSKSNMSNSTMPSILGHHHPQKISAPSSVTKQQQQPQQPKQQSSEAQLFFSNPHMQQVQCAQSNASAQYYHKRQSEQTRQTQQHQQHISVSSTTNMLSLCAPSALAQAGVPATPDPTKAMAVNSLAAANNLKGLPPTSFLNAAQLAVAAHSASVSPRPPMSATFSYMSLPPFSVKSSAEQKPTASK
ncbi:protein TIME FOR COFFEE-like isoform X1 [Zingiber officinale]|uniref:protein TIME FOR COFFEE-like isoform X1 n=1 Tax=Zingiber officinale TaxID=94328 RepID=UPI001C4C4E0B|nr:protein TIME FOR COFFEE-like isoform X1 [Zingiber officinale]